MEHTQGPWRLIGPWETLVQAGRAGRTIELATVAAIGGKVGKEVIANARLIASAPALLAALTRLSLTAGEADALHHTGATVPASVWAEVNAAGIAARAAIKQAVK